MIIMQWFIVWLAIIGWVVYRVIVQQKKAQERRKNQPQMIYGNIPYPNAGQKQQVQRQDLRQQDMQRMNPQTRTNTKEIYQKQQDIRRKQGEGHHLHQQENANTQTPYGQQNTHTIKSAEQGTQAVYQGFEGDLMQQVCDLMIMGYQPDLSFQRDFVSEGVEMLNGFSAFLGEIDC